MKKIFTLTLIAICLLFSLVSCAEERKEETGELRVLIANDSPTRTLQPDGVDIKITKYRFTLTPESGDDIVITLNRVSNGEYVINNLKPGLYTIDVKGLSDSNEERASSTLITSKYIYKGMNEIEVNIVSLLGQGTLSITVRWNPEDVRNSSGTIIDPAIYLALKNQSGEDVTITDSEKTIDLTTGTITINKVLPSGSYFFSVGLEAGNIPINGSANAVRIVNGKTTSQTFDYTRSMIEQTTFKINDNTSEPIKAHIEVTDVGPSPNNKSYRVVYDELPEGITESDVTVKWYYFDIEFAASSVTNNVLTTMLYADTQVTAIFSCYKIGSMGSATYDFKYTRVQ